MQGWEMPCWHCKLCTRLQRHRWEAGGKLAAASAGEASGLAESDERTRTEARWRVEGGARRQVRRSSVVERGCVGQTHSLRQLVRPLICGARYQRCPSSSSPDRWTAEDGTADASACRGRDKWRAKAERRAYCEAGLVVNFHSAEEAEASLLPDSHDLYRCLVAAAVCIASVPAPEVAVPVSEKRKNTGAVLRSAIRLCRTSRERELTHSFSQVSHRPECSRIWRVRIGRSRRSSQRCAPLRAGRLGRCHTPGQGGSLPASMSRNWKKTDWSCGSRSSQWHGHS
jgi:hypothetical protein